jgi:hypothetical protein
LFELATKLFIGIFQAPRKSNKKALAIPKSLAAEEEGGGSSTKDIAWKVGNSDLLLYSLEALPRGKVY